MAVNIWDNSVPVEKSAYVHENKPVFYNADNLTVPKDSLTMIDLFCGAGGFSVAARGRGFIRCLGLITSNRRLTHGRKIIHSLSGAWVTYAKLTPYK